MILRRLERIFSPDEANAALPTLRPLVEEMVAELGKNEGRVSAALGVIVRSKPFRMIRGSDHEELAP